MTRTVRTVSPEASIQHAAKIMAEADIGAVPVADGDRLCGVITDRDICIRAVCLGKGPGTQVRECMSEDVKYCFEDEDVNHVMRNMGDIQLRRLPVMNRDKRLVGILSLGDLAASREASDRLVGEALSGISRAARAEGKQGEARGGAH